MGESSEDLAAEIEYIKIKGVSYAPRECKPCHQGLANDDKTRCLLCMKNEFLEKTGEFDECKKCPKNTFSPSGSLGIESCLP